jgi:hypothetical protein
MSFATEAATIRSRFNTEWASTTPIAWPNVSFTPPSGEPWVRLEILPSGADQTTLGASGNRTFRHDGLVTVQVFVPGNEGDGEARTLAEQAAAVFRGVTVSGIRFGAPYTTTIGTDDAGWYGVVAWCPYTRDSLY